MSAIAASLSLVAFAHNIHCTGFLLHTSHITGIVDFSVFLLILHLYLICVLDVFLLISALFQCLFQIPGSQGEAALGPPTGSPFP